jgi:hypothetical protein
MRTEVRLSQARLFGRASESVTRGDRRERELGFGSPFPPLTARPNRRREGDRGLTRQSSPLGGASNQHRNGGKALTPVGHPFMTPSERRFAPTTVRQARNGVRYGLEQVSAFIGIRMHTGQIVNLVVIRCQEGRFRCSLIVSEQPRNLALARTEHPSGSPEGWPDSGVPC